MSKNEIVVTHRNESSQGSGSSNSSSNVNSKFLDQMLKTFNSEMGRLGEKIANNLTSELKKKLTALHIPQSAVETTLGPSFEKAISDAVGNAIDKGIQKISKTKGGSENINITKELKNELKPILSELNKNIKISAGESLSASQLNTILKKSTGVDINKDLIVAIRDFTTASKDTGAKILELKLAVLDISKQIGRSRPLPTKDIFEASNLKEFITAVNRLYNSIKDLKGSSTTTKESFRVLKTNTINSAGALRESVVQAKVKLTGGDRALKTISANIDKELGDKAVTLTVDAKDITKQVDKIMIDLQKKTSKFEISPVINTEGLRTSVLDIVSSGKATNTKGVIAELKKKEVAVKKKLESYVQDFAIVMDSLEEIINSSDVDKLLTDRLKQYQNSIGKSLSTTKISGNLPKINFEEAGNLSKLLKDVNIASKGKVDTSKAIKAIDSINVAGNDVTNDLYAIGKSTSDLDSNLSKVVKKASELQRVMADTVQKIDTIGDSAKNFAKSLDDVSKKTMSSIKGANFSRAIQESPSALTSFRNITTYPTETIKPSDYNKVIKSSNAYSKEVTEAVSSNVQNIAKSLEDLQAGIVKKLEAELNNSWKIVRDSVNQPIDQYFKLAKTGNIKTSGKQWKVEIVNMAAMKTKLRDQFVEGMSPTEAISKFEKQNMSKLKTEVGGNTSLMIGKWLEVASEAMIDNLEGVDLDIRKSLKNVKKEFPGKAGDKMTNKIKELFSGENIDQLFEKTYGKSRTQVDLEKSGILKSIAIPAARLSSKGEPVFETASGRTRSLPKFVTYKTGLETIAEKLLDSSNRQPSKGYTDKINSIGYSPKGVALTQAKTLSRDMLTDLFGSEKDRKFIFDQVRESSTSVGMELKKSGLKGSVREFESEIDKLVSIAEKSGDISSLFDGLEKMGMSAYDVAKSLDSLKFENVYDVYKKVLVSGAKEPLSGLAKKPYYDANVRQFEKAVNEVQGLLPVVESGRPRREMHQGRVIQLMTKTSSIYGDRSKREQLDPGEQKQLLKDLNIRFNEITSEMSELDKLSPKESMFAERRKQHIGLPKDIRTISSLGIPESQAGGGLEEWRPKIPAGAGTKHLSSLNAVTTKMYTDNLRELAPFGQQYQQWGRNIALVTNALSSASDETSKIAGGIKGPTAEYPSLMTEREAKTITGGRYGTQGYGYNVLTEIRHTANTFEDQAQISGKIAKAITEIPKKMLLPSKLSTLYEAGISGDAIQNSVDKGLKTGVFVDFTKDVGNIANQFQQMLGVKDLYKSQADIGLVKDVADEISIVRGKSVDVQAAKISELFMNFFGRKLTTRYGAKGVSISSEGPLSGISEAIQKSGVSKIRVLNEEERSEAGLGVALMPRSVGSLMSDILKKAFKEGRITKIIDNKGQESAITERKLENLTGDLLQSGNKFILPLFRDLKVVSQEEAKHQEVLLSKTQAIFKDLGINLEGLPSDMSKVKDLYTKELPKGALVEEKPIEMRISAHGIAKRGLAPEAMEAIFNNLIGASPIKKGGGIRPTVLRNEIPEEVYKDFFSNKSVLSEYSKNLGFKPADESQTLDKIREELYNSFGVGDDASKKAIADRAAALEAMSNFYTDVVDEMGKSRKGFVGEKFASIVEEPHMYEDWTKKMIDKKLKGERVNLPAYGAYSTIFGENSALMKELGGSASASSKEHWEYLKALQFVDEGNIDVRDKLLGSAKTKVFPTALKHFTESTASSEELEGTILDPKKFPGALQLMLPKPRGAEGKEQYTPFYIPPAIARGMYEEEVMPGRRAPKDISRKVAQLAFAASKVDELRFGPSELGTQISELEDKKATSPHLSEEQRSKIDSDIVELKERLFKLMEKSNSMSTDDIRKTIIERVSTKVKDINSLVRGGNLSEAGKYIDQLIDLVPENMGPQPGFPQAMAQAQPTLKKQMQMFKDLKFSLNGKTGEEGVEELRGLTGVLSDYLIGPQGDTEGYKKYISQLRGQNKHMLADAIQERISSSQNVLDVGLASGKGGELLGKTGGVDNFAAAYDKQMAELNRAIVDYYSTLSTTVLGKRGSVAEVLFSRTFPAMMKKSVVASVDRTQELESFAKELRSIAPTASSFGLAGLSSAANEVGLVQKEHAKNIEKYKEAGLPILKQTEVGIPEKTAKQIPVQFTKLFETISDKEFGSVAKSIEPTQVKGTLYDLLKHAEAIKKASEGTTDLRSSVKGHYKPEETPYKDLADPEQLNEYIDKYLVPYVETVRYPFTGISSVQPYKAKLSPRTRGKEGGRDATDFSFMVPGIPEMNFETFDKALKQVNSVIEGAVGEREKLYTSGGPGSQEKIEQLTKLIDDLNRAISAVLPRYVAHEQKLDFDGDAIEIHSATTKEARQDIKKHFDQLNSDIDSTRAAFRNVFTYEAVKQPTSGKYLFAEMSKTFEKKFPAEKGFEFLKKPFLTEQLEYLQPTEALDVLSKSEKRSPGSVLAEVVKDFVRIPEDAKDLVVDRIRELGNSTSDQLLGTLSKEFPDFKLDKALPAGIKKATFDSRYKDAIEAQLFKLHTGIETESLYRVQRMAETYVGFGGGQIDPKAEYRSAPGFKKKWPDLKGSEIDSERVVKPEFEYHTMLNELMRFTQQKGMDVKHAGVSSVAGTITEGLRKGVSGAEDLYKSIMPEDKNDVVAQDKAKESFGELQDFIKASNTSIERRYQRLPTETIREDFGKLVSARNIKINKPATEMSRGEMISKIVETTGFKGFLIDLAEQIRAEAIEGLTEAYKQEPSKGDPRIRATKQVNKEMAGSGINIGKNITSNRMPLYNLRVKNANTEFQLDRFNKAGRTLPESGMDFGVIDQNNPTEAYRKKYAEAFATAKMVGSDFKNISENFGGGAYAQMVTSAIENLYENQKKVNELLENAQGFENELNTQADVFERLSTGKGIPKYVQSIIDVTKDDTKSIRAMQDKVSDLTNTVGAPILTALDLQDINRARPEFEQLVKQSFTGSTVSPSEEDMDKRRNSIEASAKALKQMDVVLETLKGKEGEGKLLADLLPSKETLNNIKNSAKIVDFTVADHPTTSGPSTIDKGWSEASKYFDENFKKKLSGEEMYSQTGMKFSEDKCIPVKNCGKPLDVFIVGASGNVNIGGNLSAPSNTDDDNIWFPSVDGADFSREKQTAAKQRADISKARLGNEAPINTKGFTSDSESTYAGLKEMHTSARDFQRSLHKLNLSDLVESMPKSIKKVLTEVGTEGPSVDRANELIRELDVSKEKGEITGGEFTKIWKAYRLAVGDYYVNKIEHIKAQMDEVKKQEGVDAGIQEESLYQEFKDSTEKFKQAIQRSLAKPSDIYTTDKKFFRPEAAKMAGVYKNPSELTASTEDLLGDRPYLKNIFSDIVGDLGGGDILKSPVNKARDAVNGLVPFREELVKIAKDGELASRMGKEFKDAWDFKKAIDDISILRASLEKFAKFNFTEEFAEPQKINLSNTIKLLKQFEKSFSMGTPSQEGEKEWGSTHLTKVLPWLEPEQQRAIHRRNVESLKTYFAKPETEGGPQVGDRFRYNERVLGSTGEVVRNLSHDFHKYGEYVDRAGRQVGAFSVEHQDLIGVLQGTNRGFAAAFGRVVRWGAAATIVYGGVAKLKEMIGTITEVEYAMASLRMVMSPIDTDFGKLEKSAISFAKEFGVPTTKILKGMNIFAQQGLNQEEVIERTRTAVLASNVTTLDAKDATEALTAATKIYGKEGTGTMRFIDAWSEVEAKHAVTAGDMANAVKKSASAAKNAGVEFDELNGIVSAVGSVTRQTGGEVGTGLRFMFSRLTTEKAPKELAQLGIPVMSDTGEMRKGFDILSDLHGAWGDLNSAQKMTIAQAIGGVRQYNQVLVLMDNWNEVLSAIKDSTNSKGSAERRNIEVMKTYAKQLEQTKQAAVELQLEFGKVFLPLAKTSLKGITVVLETFTAIPSSIKAAAVAMGLFVTYAAKGGELINKLGTGLRVGSTLFGDFASEAKKGFKQGGYEIFGIGKEKIGYDKDLMGLNTIGKGRTLRDFHSALGKTGFLITEAGKHWNEFLGSVTVGSGEFSRSLGKGNKDLSKIFGKVADYTSPFSATGMGTAMKVANYGGPELGFATTIGETIVASGAIAAENTTKIIGDNLDKLGGKLGSAGHGWIEKMTGPQTGFAGVAKTTLPLIVSLTAGGIAMKSLYNHYKKITQSAQDYQKSVYGLRSANESELVTIRSLSDNYEDLGKRRDDIKRSEDPTFKTRRIGLNEYKSPLVGMEELQKKSVETSNTLAEANMGLVVGYDKLGNAIIKAGTNLESFLRVMEKSKLKEIASNEIDVIDKYVSSLTETGGPEKWKYELKNLLKEAPLVGEMLSKPISVSPAKMLMETGNRLNTMVAQKNKYPVSNAFDKDIKEYQLKIKDIRNEFNATYSDFLKAMSNISAKGLNPDEISNIFSDERLQKGYKLMLDVEPRFNLPGTKGKIKWQDIMGSEVMNRVFPSTAPFLDAYKELSKSKLETAGIAPRSGKVMSGDLVTFMDTASDKYKMAGNQAIVSLKETTDGVFEWVASYFNTKTLKIIERPFDKDMQKLVDNVFPVKRIEDDVAERIDYLNEFIAGAASGLRGISAKDFKRDFNLGERFFSDIPTTTLLQSNKGYIPGKGFGESPFQKEWSETADKFFLTPMKDYRNKIEDLKKLQLEGLEGSNVTLSKGLFEEITKLQDLLKNNQVVMQYRAVFADLTKTIEQGTRALREELAVEKSRIEHRTVPSGYMKGISEGLDNINIGIQSKRELNAAQRSLISSPAYRDAAGVFKQLGIKRESSLQNIENIERAKVALSSIQEVSKGFGATLDPDKMKNYVEMVAKTGDKGTSELILETRNVEKNTASTVDRLEDLLQVMDNKESVKELLSTTVPDIVKSMALRTSFSGQVALKTMERVSRVRDKAVSNEDQDTVIKANEALDELSKAFVGKYGIEKAMSKVRWNVAMPFGKHFKPEELAQRAFGGQDLKTITTEIESQLPGKGKWWQLGFGKTKPKFEKDVGKLTNLQKESNEDQLFSSKQLTKMAAAMVVFEQFNKGSSRETIKRLEDQLDMLDQQIVVTKNEGKDFEKLLIERASTEKALSSERKNLNLYKTAQTFSTVGGGAMEFAKALGFTEGGIKKTGLAAIGTYAALHMASKVTGEETPESAKEFGKILKEVGKTAITNPEGLTFVDGAKFYKAAKSMTKDYATNIKKATGFSDTQAQNIFEDKNFTAKLNEVKDQIKEIPNSLDKVAEYSAKGPFYKSYAELRDKHIKEQGELYNKGLGFRTIESEELFKKQAKEMADTFKDVSSEDRKKIIEEYPLKGLLSGIGIGSSINTLFPKEVFERAMVVGSEARQSVGDRPINHLQIPAALATYTLAGYGLEKQEDKTRVANLKDKAQDQADLFADLLRKYPDAAQKVLNEFKEKADLGIKKNIVPTEEFNKALDTDATKDKIVSDINIIKSQMVSELDGIVEGMSEFSHALASIQIAEQIKMEIEALNQARSNRKSSFDINSSYNITPNLYTGVGGLLYDKIAGTSNKTGIFKSITTTIDSALQQRSDTMTGFSGNLNIPVPFEERSVHEKMYQGGGSRLKDAMRNYSFYSSELGARGKDLEGLIEKRNEQEDIMKSAAPPEVIDVAKQKWEALNEQVKNSKNELESMTKTLQNMSTPLRNLTEFFNITSEVSSNLKNLATQHTANERPGTQQVRLLRDSMVGGAHPLAPIPITPEQERMGMRVGVRLLDRQANRMQLEKAQLLTESQTARGDQLTLVNERLNDLPKKYSREISAYMQKPQDDMLQQQMAVWTTAVGRLEKFKQAPGISKSDKVRVEILQKEIEQSQIEGFKPYTKEEMQSKAYEKATGFQKFMHNNLNWSVGSYGRALDQIKTGGEKQYWGVGPQASEELYDKMKGISNELVNDVTGENFFGKFGKDISNPIVNSLEEQTEILKAIANKEYNINNEDVKESIKDFDKPSSTGSKVLDFYKSILPGIASGGPITGPGGPKEDRVPAMLSPGEYVIKASTAKKLGYSALDWLNTSGKLPVQHFSNGGGVTGWLGRRNEELTTVRRGLLDVQNYNYEKHGKRRSEDFWDAVYGTNEYAGVDKFSRAGSILEDMTTRLGTFSVGSLITLFQAPFALAHAISSVGKSLWDDGFSATLDKGTTMAKTLISKEGRGRIYEELKNAVLEGNPALYMGALEALYGGTALTGALSEASTVSRLGKVGAGIGKAGVGIGRATIHPVDTLARGTLNVMAGVETGAKVIKAPFKLAKGLFKKVADDRPMYKHLGLKPYEYDELIYNFSRSLSESTSLERTPAIKKALREANIETTASLNKFMTGTKYQSGAPLFTSIPGLTQAYGNANAMSTIKQLAEVYKANPVLMVAGLATDIAGKTAKATTTGVSKLKPGFLNVFDKTKGLASKGLEGLQGLLSSDKLSFVRDSKIGSFFSNAIDRIKPTSLGGENVREVSTKTMASLQKFKVKGISKMGSMMEDYYKDTGIFSNPMDKIKFGEHMAVFGAAVKNQYGKLKGMSSEKIETLYDELFGTNGAVTRMSEAHSQKSFSSLEKTLRARNLNYYPTSIRTTDDMTNYVLHTAFNRLDKKGLPEALGRPGITGKANPPWFADQKRALAEATRSGKRADSTIMEIIEGGVDPDTMEFLGSKAIKVGKGLEKELSFYVTAPSATTDNLNVASARVIRADVRSALTGVVAPDTETDVLRLLYGNNSKAKGLFSKGSGWLDEYKKFKTTPTQNLPADSLEKTRRALKVAFGAQKGAEDESLKALNEFIKTPNSRAYTDTNFTVFAELDDELVSGITFSKSAEDKVYRAKLAGQKGGEKANRATKMASLHLRDLVESGKLPYPTIIDFVQSIEPQAALIGAGIFNKQVKNKLTFLEELKKTNPAEFDKLKEKTLAYNYPMFDPDEVAGISGMVYNNRNYIMDVLANINRKASGGSITGPGGPKEDRVPAMLSDGEYVIKASAVNSIGAGVLNYINKTGKLPNKFADGGQVLFNPNNTPFTEKRRWTDDDFEKKPYPYRKEVHAVVPLSSSLRIAQPKEYKMVEAMLMASKLWNKGDSEKWRNLDNILSLKSAVEEKEFVQEMHNYGLDGTFKDGIFYRSSRPMPYTHAIYEIMKQTSDGVASRLSKMGTTDNIYTISNEDFGGVNSKSNLIPAGERFIDPYYNNGPVERTFSEVERGMGIATNTRRNTPVSFLSTYKEPNKTQYTPNYVNNNIDPSNPDRVLTGRRHNYNFGVNTDSKAFLTAPEEVQQLIYADKMFKSFYEFGESGFNEMFGLSEKAYAGMWSGQRAYAEKERKKELDVFKTRYADQRDRTVRLKQLSNTEKDRITDPEFRKLYKEFLDNKPYLDTVYRNVEMINKGTDAIDLLLDMNKDVWASTETTDTGIFDRLFEVAQRDLFKHFVMSKEKTNLYDGKRLPSYTELARDRQRAILKNDLGALSSDYPGFRSDMWGVTHDDLIKAGVVNLPGAFSRGGIIRTLDKYHDGGVVRQTGPAVLQQGEVVIPKRFAGGGEVTGDGLKISGLGSSYNNELKMSISNTKDITKDIEEAFNTAIKSLEGVELKVKDTELKVATIDPIKVDVPEFIKYDGPTTLSLDTTEIIAKLDRDTVSLDTTEVRIINPEVRLLTTEVTAKLDRDTIIAILDRDSIIATLDRDSIRLENDTVRLESDVVHLENDTIKAILDRDTVGLSIDTIKVDISNIPTSIPVDTSNIPDIIKVELIGVPTSIPVDAPDFIPVDRTPLPVEDKEFTVKIDASNLPNNIGIGGQEVMDDLKRTIANIDSRIDDLGAGYRQAMESLVDNKVTVLNDRIDILSNSINPDILADNIRILTTNIQEVDSKHSTNNSNIISKINTFVVKQDDCNRRIDELLGLVHSRN